MKRIMMMLLTACLLFAGVWLNTDVVQAGENRTSIQVKYEPGAKKVFHTLTLSVSGGGHVMDGSQIIKEGILTYELQEGEEKTFLLEPYQGYRLKSAEYEADRKIQDIKSKMQDSRVTIHMGNADSVLNVVFEQESGQPVKTGDSSDIAKYLIFMLAAIAACAGICIVRKKRT